MEKSGADYPIKTTVMLTNHKPRVSKVYLSTDLNGDGKYTDNELGGQSITASEGGTVGKKFYSALNGSVWNGESVEGTAQEVATLTNKANVKDAEGNYYGTGLTMREKLGFAFAFASKCTS